MRLSTLVLSLLVVTGFAACKRHAPETSTAGKDASAIAAQPANVPAESTSAAPAAASANAAPAAAKFDVASVPVTTKELPAFPYLATPAELKPNQVFTEKDVEFDRVYVVAGNELHPVEGKVLHRKFFLHELKWSPLAAHRNYENALKALGATRVDKVHPTDEQFVQRNGGDTNVIWTKMGTPTLSRGDEADAPGYEQWLLRTPKANIWLSFFIENGQLGLLTVEEKAMQQQVQALPAAELSNALRKDGHVALYLNFDTDSQVIRPDSLPAVGEIVKLLQDEPALKLRVEGHTDSTGDAAHNRTLSLARAQSVVQAVTAKQIAAERLSAVGKGPDVPLADNATEEGKAKNRRVELVRV